ncbi:hypothetical protein B0D71_05085 [Pseudomonas laurylsulfativorans]|uniref:Molybdopterin dinucleotide-binding domain-containing protein n=1 Tax=Pseudomonas laurylsulfativorans TaxID=1943631 RepID=A0A2S3VW45_9PSED|nr:hypothetical protein [Pseudomonas laurylsulfativorans]POF44168.1 hypothetical protein B0D71_05085 [Pseudomonas laurylsulfativorans]
MSQVDRYKPYKGAAAGWGALIAVTKNWLGSENALKNIRAMLKTNQNGGFDCPGCAWGESPESGMVKFCENGAKAVNWEATGRLVDPAFFNKYSVSALAEQSDYWLEYQGRLTRPMPNDAAKRIWKTASGKAQFTPSVLPEHLISEGVRNLPVKPPLILQTMRSHDQYNTTLYGLDDRYRGVYGMRDVVFANEQDIRRLGFEPGQKVDLVALWDDERERRVSGFTLIAYDIPAGQAAAYYPETNPLVPLESYGDRTFTPTSKFVAIRLEQAKASNRISTSAA